MKRDATLNHVLSFVAGSLVAFGAVLAQPTTSPDGILTSDGDRIGPYEMTDDGKGFRPKDEQYSTRELAQNCCALYWALRRWRALLPEDVNGDGVVDFDDITAVLGAWGKTREP